MARETVSLYSLNRGVIDRRGLARVDVKRLALAAENQTNWMPRVLGAASLRPGLGYIGGIYSNREERLLRFIFSTTDTALLELTDSLMRVWINDEVLTRPAVSTTITNGTFPVDLSGWTSYDEAGAASTWLSPSYMQLVGTGSARAIREQQVTCLSAGVEHGIRISIRRGPVTLRIGSTSGGDDYVSETTLYTGEHSLSIKPTGDFYIRFFSSLARAVIVKSCVIEGAGEVTVATPWTASDLDNVRYDQSGDVIWVACAGMKQQRIERRGTRPNARGWSVVDYDAEDGPFQIQNTGPITLTPTAITGNILVTASASLFKTTSIGALYSITSTGQQVTATGAASGIFTSSIRITGVDSERTFSIVITGNASASTVDLQRSYDDATWVNVGGAYSYTTNVTDACTDGLNNQIVYYRLNLSTRVAPDSVTMELKTGAGSVRGIVRVTSYISETAVRAEVLSDLGGTSASKVWQEGQWSDRRGWPTAVRFHEGRLWWLGKNGVWGSISDAYDSFDETFVGDAGPISRTIGSGPVDTINWGLSLKGLVVGAQGAEFTARASSLDEPLTPTSFNLKSSSTQGSGAVEAIKIDQAGYFVNRSGVKVFELTFDIRSYDYQSDDLMQLAPEIGRPGIVRMDCQRQPDTRLHCVRSDGTAVVCVINRTEQVVAWIPIATDGYIEDVAVLPALTGNIDDQVYYVVKRTVNGSPVRFLEKWAQEVDCRGDQALCLLADSHITYSGAPTTTISAPHLAGREVVVWADGQDIGTDDSAETWTQRYTLDASGNATLSAEVSAYVVGLGYGAQFKSAKLGMAAQISPLNQQKKIGHIGLVLCDTHPRGLRFGPSFDALDDMPLIEDGAEVGTATVTDYDQNLIEFPGTWTTDARVCLVAAAPRPCTVTAVTIDMQRNS